jgi:membrane protein YdbS with pleckstrin-like domain
MKFLLVLLVLIIAGVTALFVIDKSDALLLSAILTIIVGFWFAVFQIPKEESE